MRSRSGKARWRTRMNSRRLIVDPSTNRTCGSPASGSRTRATPSPTARRAQAGHPRDGRLSRSERHENRLQRPGLRTAMVLLPWLLHMVPTHDGAEVQRMRNSSLTRAAYWPLIGDPHCTAASEYLCIIRMPSSRRICGYFTDAKWFFLGDYICATLSASSSGYQPH
jgi:hypothetical protein